MNRSAFILLFAIIVFPYTAFSQNKKILNHDAFDVWKSIENVRISNDGRWVSYVLQPGEGNEEVFLWDAEKQEERSFVRASEPVFPGKEWLVFKIQAHVDTIKMLRRKKVKKENLPLDTLAIYNVKRKELLKIPGLKSLKTPDDWGGWIAFVREIEVEKIEKDTVKKTEKLEQLVVYDLAKKREAQIIPNVKDYQFAEKAPYLLFHSENEDSTFQQGVYWYDLKADRLKALKQDEGKYKKLSLHESGTKVAFLADTDTTKARVRPFELYYWERSLEEIKKVTGPSASFFNEEWRIHEEGNLSFSKNGEKLFFGIAPPPVLQDTALLPEEIVEVEVWTYKDARLYPQQNVNADRERKRTFRSVFNIKNNQLIALADETCPEVRLGDEGDANFYMGYNEMPYLERVSWEGFPSYKDYYIIDGQSGKKELVLKEEMATPSLSPKGKYIYWYARRDSAWMTMEVEKKEKVQITTNEEVLFYDELSDYPNFPSAYGTTGWMADDKAVLINDRFDIWKIDPAGGFRPVNLTNQRENRISCRYLRLDREKRFFEEDDKILLLLHHEDTHEEGYAWLDLASGEMERLEWGPFRFSSRPVKAKEAERYIFTKESFDLFPDLLYTKDFVETNQISKANPQQSEYRWGNVELYEWTALDGQRLNGLLVKPEDFDPSKKYPMIVYFYERSSRGLHRHRAPEPHRSTINFSFYTSRGYLIFNPDVPYRVGYPGESAYNSVVSGVTSLINEGFVDSERIGAQGHSWGGYQVAYLATRTDIFKCIESGAPVVNMTSAYGGIRWRSGLSRMFQYEHSQSRIGGTLWEKPLRYIENSPLFFLDKVNTPILILHNDKDGAVPWYQGIEFFVGLRRLGKPAWMLNYNNEPHWPVKLQNRKDFQKRMQQFFDYYLLDAPMPKWMQKGVPALEKGIKQGLELIGE